MIVGFFKDKTDAELYREAESFAVAQEKMAADSKEDFTPWHHVAVASLIMELARRMVGKSADAS